MSKYTFPSDLKCVNTASQKVIDEINSQAIDPGEIIDIKLCFEEAFINAAKHGNCFNSELKVNVEVVLDEKSVGIFIRDEGEGFDFENCPDPTKQENLEKTSGRGIFLIKHFMDESHYDNNTKCLFMKKYFKK